MKTCSNCAKTLVLGTRSAEKRSGNAHLLNVFRTTRSCTVCLVTRQRRRKKKRAVGQNLMTFCVSAADVVIHLLGQTLPLKRKNMLWPGNTLLPRWPSGLTCMICTDPSHWGGLPRISLAQLSSTSTPHEKLFRATSFFLASALILA